MKTAQEILKETIEFMETLRDFDTWKEWRNTDPIEPVQEAEFTSYQEVFDSLSSLSEWEEVKHNSDQYHLVFEGTQGLNPLTWGNTLDYHYAEYNFNGLCYRLRWKVGSLGTNNNPIIEIKSK